jgi:hypothetical protein
MLGVTVGAAMAVALVVAFLPLHSSTAATAHGVDLHWWRGQLMLNNTSALTCEPLPSDAEVPELFLLGQGRCTNAQGLTPQTFACNATASPDACAAVGANASACAAQCFLDDGCTGFELRSDPTSGAAQCLVIYNTLPASSSLPWALGDNGTQLPTGRTVVTTDGSSLACCYRRAYPRPLPRDMPIVKPPQQTDRVRDIFAGMATKAAAASAAVLPALESFIAFCAVNATDSAGDPQDLFGVVACPGLADLTANGTLAPYPTAAQIVQRFADELRAMEFGHGYAPLWGVVDWGCEPDPCLLDHTLAVDPTLPVLPNLYHPMTLGWNSTPAATGSIFTGLQTTLFGLDPFLNGGQYTLNFTDAANRMVYTASNYVRSPMGNILHDVGTFNAVPRPSYVRRAMLTTPADSWMYHSVYPNCVQWANCTAGTLDDSLHILYAWMTGGGALTQFTPTPTNTTCGEQCEFLRFAVCAMGPNYDRQSAYAYNPDLYWEVDAVGMIRCVLAFGRGHACVRACCMLERSPRCSSLMGHSASAFSSIPRLLPPAPFPLRRYPEGVKLITVSFADNFGTWYGSLLREWCRHWGWALAWVLHDGSNIMDGRRLLDPTVLASTTVNASLNATVAPAFEAMWAAANASRATPVNFTDYAAVWAAFVNESNTPTVGNALTWNIGVRDCEDYDNCFGLAHSTGTCVCYLNRTEGV